MTTHFPSVRQSVYMYIVHLCLHVHVNHTSHRHGHFSGINQEVQFKQLNGKCSHVQSPHGQPPDKGQGCHVSCDNVVHVFYSGPQPTTQLLLLILKWGGELTSVGQRQAEELGRAFRCMYPGGEGEYASLPGSGFLRLHSTYRHDLKVYASDEGRVQMTTAAFTKVHCVCVKMCVCVCENVCLCVGFVDKVFWEYPQLK